MGATGGYVLRAHNLYDIEKCTWHILAYFMSTEELKLGVITCILQIQRQAQWHSVTSATCVPHNQEVIKLDFHPERYSNTWCLHGFILVAPGSEFNLFGFRMTT